MKTQKLMFATLFLAAGSALTACAFDTETEAERLGTAEQGLGGTQSNNISPQAIAAVSASLPITDAYDITSSPSVVDPLQLCEGSVTSSCTLRREWDNWLNDSAGSPRGKDAVSHGWMLKGFAKCALDSGFTINSRDGTQSFPGEVGLYTGWKTGRLTGTDNRERVSGCIIALLNGNNVSIHICMIGPGAPYNAACDDPTFNTREAGFFGNLFTTKPTAYVAGPNLDQLVDTGRVCTSNTGSYCCLESDSNSVCGNGNKIVLVPGILERCHDNPLPSAGGNQYCTSFYSTKEPGRSYNHGFTTFIPAP